MKKSELIEQMAKDACITKVAAGHALGALIEGVTIGLNENNGRVTLTGFGTFFKAHRKAYSGRNPRTGEPIVVKARNTVKFKAAKALKDEL